MSLGKFFKSLISRPASPTESAPPAQAPASANAATPGRPAPLPTNEPVAPSEPAPSRPPSTAPTTVPNLGGMTMKVQYGGMKMSWGSPKPAPAQTPDQLFDQALTQHKQGQLQSAAQGYQAVLDAQPQHAHALHYLGLLHVQGGQPESGMALIEESLRINPQQFAALGNLAGALQEAGRFTEALDKLDAALAIQNDAAALWNNRGNVLLALSRIDEAIDSFRQALQRQPQMATAANHLAASLSMRGLHQAALEAADQAIAAAPDLADAHDTRGNALRKLNRLPEALASYERALALQPGAVAYMANRCSVLEDMDHYELALQALRDIRAIQPDFPGLAGRLLHAQKRCMDWSGIDTLTQQVIDQTLAGQLSDSPLNMLANTDRAPVQLAASRLAQADQPQVARTPLSPRPLSPTDKVRLAYVSADLREHAVSYLMAGVFEQHDRARFEVWGISLRPPEDSPMGRRVQQAFDHFVDVSAWPDDEIVQRLREWQIDIAVDLMGPTFGARPGVWAQGIAPKQVSYLGFPGTTGAPYMDAILADTVVIPPEQAPHYSEQVAYLPESFQANDSQRTVAANMPTRSECGLPEQGFVFCAFNNVYKIGPAAFDSWMRILAQVPGSVLWLVDDQDVVRRHAAQEAQARGIDPHRLIFAKRLPYPEHLARLQQADLFLDTLPFNAGTTASDALWAGLPVLTQPGQAFASRMAASLLTTIGLPELIATSTEQYEALAIELARTPQQLQNLRQRLATQRKASPLFDTHRFVRHLEQAYVTMLH